MRKDMAKVVVERPRLGGHRSRVGRTVNTDQLPVCEGMRAPHVRGHWGGKELNENLAPLRRFLHSKVGQPWDQVYSEICENLRANSTVQQHVRDHVTDFVAVNCCVREGEVWVHDYCVRPLRSSWSQLYVHPHSGILEKNPYYQTRNQINKTWKAERQQSVYATQRCVAGVQLRKHQGVWYEVQVLRIPPYTMSQRLGANGIQYNVECGGWAYDVIQQTTVYLHSAGYYNVPIEYCAHKRQLRSAELKKYGVQND